MICHVTAALLIHSENIVSYVPKPDTYVFCTQRTALLSISKKIYYITIHPIETTRFAYARVSCYSPQLAKAGSSAFQLQVFADSQMFLQFLGLSSESLVAHSLPG